MTPYDIAQIYIESLKDATGTNPATFVTSLDQIDLDIDPNTVQQENFWDTKQAENLTVWYDDVVETSLANDVLAWLDVHDEMQAPADDVIAEVLNFYSEGVLVPDTSLEEMLNAV